MTEMDQDGGRSNRIAGLLAAVACVAVRWAVRLQPRAFRERFGAAVVAETCEEIHGAVRRGIAATCRVSLYALMDAWSGAGAERVSALHPASSGNGSALRGLRTDLVIASRRVRSQAMLSAIVVVTLGLAIGASAAIFSVTDAVLLRPLPFPESDRLVKLDEETATPSRSGMSLPALEIIGK